jgi:hypothetical protein
LDRDREEAIAGKAWTESEISAVVDSYFQMLAYEKAGIANSKADNWRRLMTTVHRSKGSIERKLQNISAVLDVLGAQWISGYKPLKHYQDALVPAVERNIHREPSVLYPAGPDTQPLALYDDAVFVPPPQPADHDDVLPPAIRQLVGKFDPAERDARNRELGKAGEQFVVEFERDRLRRAGRDDLADNVRWVADLDGDGYGYDVRTFEPDGEERLLEVKTTCGHERTPFWLTRREVDVAEQRSDIYRIRRVFHFRNNAQMFQIAPPLNDVLVMSPSTYTAEPR